MINPILKTLIQAKKLSGQQFTIPDIVHRPAYETLSVFRRLAEAQIEAVAVQEIPRRGVAVDEGRNGSVVITQSPQLAGCDRGFLRLIPGSSQNQGIGGPLDGSPRLIRGVPDVPRLQPLYGGTVESAGVGENLSHPVGGCHFLSLVFLLAGQQIILRFVSY